MAWLVRYEATDEPGAEPRLTCFTQTSQFRFQNFTLDTNMRAANNAAMNKLRAYRKTIEKTQAELADMLGLSQSLVSRIESGVQIPKLDLAVRIERMTNGAVPAASWIDDAATTTAGIGE